MNSQPVASARPVKSRLKLGLMFGLIFGLAIGISACVPFILDFKEKYEIETAAKNDVLEVVKITTDRLNKKTEDVEKLEETVSQWNKKFDDESKLRQSFEGDVQQKTALITQLKESGDNQAKQIQNLDNLIKESRAESEQQKRAMTNLQRERDSLSADLEETELRLKTMLAQRSSKPQIPDSQRRARRDATMTVAGMTEDSTAELVGPVNSMRIVNWPSKKKENLFCYEASRNGQRVTLYFNLIPFAVIEHKKLQSEDKLVLSWKTDSPLFFTDASKRNRNVTFEKRVIYQLSKTDVAFLYESKVATEEKYVELNFVED